ncbi:SelB domain-containing protein [Brachyspira pilosicoli]|nr:SelB C-terminal domain-containing protein [Brachyspira pilosicoli]
MALVKERTGLSRKYTIPILNALEREKLVKRQGNDRIVL